MENMTRNRIGQIRSKLENAILTLVDAEEMLPLVRLRVQQSLTQTGMISLLSPAFDEIDRIEASIQNTKAQLKDATDKLLEK
jgi:hypothetical protein